jgi:hypothetical protein
MKEHEMRDAYESALQRGDVAQPVDLPLDRLEALVAGDGSEADRLRSIDVLMSSAEGRREFEVAWAASRAAREHVANKRVRVASWRNLSLASAAVLLIAATTLWLTNRKRGEGDELMRGQESPIRLLSPGSEIESARNVQFAWQPVKQAKDYVLIVVDTAGGDVYARNTTDTTVSLPDSVRLNPGSEYLWWVQAIMPDGSTLTAVTERFRVNR